MRDYARYSWIRSGLEHVREDAAKPLPCDFGGEDGNRAVAKHDRPRVVQPETVIGVRVREQNRGQMLEAYAKCLLAKVRRGIDEDVLTPMFDQHRGAEPVVARVIRQTGVAFAADGRNADGCARAEKGDPHCLLESATNCIRRSASMFSSRLSSSAVRLPRVLL